MVTFSLGQHIGQPSVVEAVGRKIRDLKSKPPNLYFDQSG